LPPLSGVSNRAVRCCKTISAEITRCNALKNLIDIKQVICLSFIAIIAITNIHLIISNGLQRVILSVNVLEMLKISVG
jgi:hypothetical protein